METLKVVLSCLEWCPNSKALTFLGLRWSMALERIKCCLPVCHHKVYETKEEEPNLLSSFPFLWKAESKTQQSSRCHSGQATDTDPGHSIQKVQNKQRKMEAWKREPNWGHQTLSCLGKDSFSYCSISAGRENKKLLKKLSYKCKGKNAMSFAASQKRWHAAEIWKC